MRHSLFFLSLIAFAGCAHAQYDSVRVVTTTRIISKSDVPAEATYDNAILLQPATFTGGENALIAHFATALKSMTPVEGAPMSGAVEVSFIIEADGTVNEVRVSRGVHPDVDKQVLRAAINMPNWQPAVVKDQPVRVRAVRMITF